MEALRAMGGCSAPRKGEAEGGGVGFGTPPKGSGGGGVAGGCSPPGDSPAPPVVEVVEEKSVGSLAAEEKVLARRREQLRLKLARLNVGTGRDGRVVRLRRAAHGPENSEETEGQRPATSPRHSTEVGTDTAGRAAATHALETQIRQMQEEWEKERETWKKISESAVEEAARVSAQEAEKMLGAWRKAAAERRTDATTQTPDVGAESSTAAPARSNSTQDGDSVPLSVELLAKRQAQQDRLRQDLKVKLASVLLDPRTSQENHGVVDKVHRKVRELEVQIAGVQEERRRERVTFEQARTESEMTLVQEREKAVAVATALERDMAEQSQRLRQVSSELSLAEKKIVDIQNEQGRERAAFEQARTASEMTLVQERDKAVAAASLISATAARLKQEMQEQQAHTESQKTLIQEREKVATLQKTNAEQAAELEMCDQKGQRLTNQLDHTHQRIESLTNQNYELEQRVKMLQSNRASVHPELQTQLSEANIQVAQLERALQELTNKSAADRTSFTTELARISVQNSCRHAVRTHESREEIKALHRRHELELAAAEVSWHGGIELEALFHEAAAEVDNEIAQQRILTSVVHKVRHRSVMKTFRWWRDSARHAQVAWLQARAKDLEQNANLQDVLLSDMATKLEQSTRMQARLIREFTMQDGAAQLQETSSFGALLRSIRRDERQQDQILAKSLVDNVFAKALPREAAEYTRSQTSSAAAIRRPSHHVVYIS